MKQTIAKMKRYPIEWKKYGYTIELTRDEYQRSTKSHITQQKAVIQSKHGQKN